MTTRVDMGDERRRRQARRQAEAVVAATQPATKADLAAITRTAPSGRGDFGGLPALQYRNTPALPPSKLAHRHHAELGDRLASVEKARSAALTAAQAWAATQPGGSVFRNTVEAERTVVYRHLDKQEPVTGPGPILRLLTTGQPEALAFAWRAQLEADYREAAVREYAPEAKDTLAALADSIEHEIEGLWVKVKGESDRRVYEDGHALCGPWNEVAALYTWTLDPSLPFRQRPVGSFPEALRWPQRKAEEALGIVRPIVDALTPEDVEAADEKNQPQGFIRRMLGS